MPDSRGRGMGSGSFTNCGDYRLAVTPPINSAAACGVDATLVMRRRLRPYLTAAVVIAGASLIAVPSVAPVPHVQARAVRLTSGDTADSPLGDSTALIMGTSGNPDPPPSYLAAIDQLYLEPRGFDGTTQLLITPEALYPFTGVKSLPFDTSEAQDQQILDAAILNQIAAGGVSAENPIVVWGWSQSSDISGLAMPQLTAQGVPSDDVHFVLTGDANNPDGGVLDRFAVDGLSPTVPSLGIPFGEGTPADLYPTDIYTNEYDGAADFPRYPIDFLSDLNAGLGIIFDHILYPVDTPEQIQNAIQLPTSVADTLTDYYMIPEDLPLLEPLRFIPVIGNPLADLLQPDLAVLVNLGYGSTTQGWDPGYADVTTPLGFLPPLSVLEQVPEALVQGAQQGITAAIDDLQDPENYQIIPSILDNGFINQAIDVSHLLGYTDATDLSSLLDYPSLQDAIPNLLDVAQKALAGFAGFPISDVNLLSSPTDLLDDLASTVSADYASVLPVADAVTALLTSLPTYDADVFASQLQDGNLLGAIGDPIAADLVLIPTALIFAAAAPVEAAVGTLVNVVDLIPGL
jgi:hypothetical protein